METKVWKVRYRNADDFGGRVSAEGFYCLIGPLGLGVDVWWSIKHVDPPHCIFHNDKKEKLSKLTYVYPTLPRFLTMIHIYNELQGAR